MLRPVVLALRKEIVHDKILCNLIGVMCFTTLTIIGGYIRIPLPFTPVPITAQTLFVILAGALLGARLGLASQAFYVFLGIIGFPVFQNCGSGLLYLAGPTGGYLLGFIIAPLVVGRLISIKKDDAFWWATLAMATGSFVILFLGTTYLIQFLRLGIKEGIVLGMLYFLPGDLVKIVLATLIYMTCKNRAGRMFGLEG